MDYSAASVKFLLWYVETRETAKLLEKHTFDEINKMVIEDNLYQQKSRQRMQSEFGCIKKRLEALPVELARKMTVADIQTAKIIILIGCMATDRLLFEVVYEIYRVKLKYGEEEITDADFNVFFQNKAEQSEKVSGFSIATIKKLKQTYTRYLVDVGLICVTDTGKKVGHPFLEPEIRDVLFQNHMDQYWYALTGEK